MTTNLVKTKAVLLALILLLAIPSFSQAASYQPRTNEEMIAYLYGRISQLLDMQRVLASGGSISDMQSDSANHVSIYTRRATEITYNAAVLRAEVFLYGDATASVWFEYGQDEKFLDLRTGKTTVRTAYDRAVRKRVASLEEDERYYFRIVTEDKNGIVSYGDIYAFTTEEQDN